jgi:hypothetical protein
VGAFVPITLAGKSYNLRELPRRANREFQALVAAEVRKAMAESPVIDTADEAMDAIAQAGELWLDLFIAYDVAGKAWPGHTPVLPDREWINDRATDRECYDALKKVLAVSFPPGADLLRLLPELRPWLLQAVSRGVAAATVAMTASYRSTSSAPPSTRGDRSTSKPASPTPSSLPTSTKRSSGVTAKAKSSATASPSL